MSWDPKLMNCSDGKSGHRHRFRVSFKCKFCQRKVEQEVLRRCVREQSGWNFMEPKKVKCKNCKTSTWAHWHCQRGHNYSNHVFDESAYIILDIENIDD